LGIKIKLHYGEKTGAFPEWDVKERKLDGGKNGNE